MTIRDQLEKAERPYKRTLRIFLLMFLIGGLLMITSSSGDAAHDLVRGHVTSQVALLLVVCALYGVGGIGCILVSFLASLRLRCPKCNGRLGPNTKHWNHCPLCGVHLESHLASTVTQEEHPETIS